MTINVHIFLTVHRHGKTHNIVQRKDIPQQPEKIQKEHTVFNYHSARLQLGLFMANLSDAIKHGDGQRLLRCYKFALHVLLCYKHKHTKYAFKFSLLYLKLIRKLNGGKSAHARCKNSGNNQTCPFSIIACFVFALSHKNRFSWFFIFSCAALSIK